MKPAPNPDLKPEVPRSDAARGMAKIGAATLLFAAWHSLLCSDGAKETARALLGERRGTGFYRAGFMAQSALSTGALVLYLLRQPHRTIYRARGALKLAGWAGQLASGIVFALALGELDKPKFLGLKGVNQAQNPEGNIEEAQAQGPELEDDDATVRASGVFRYSRHPLEWAPIALLFCSPKMKTNWLAFDILAAIYSVVGALHEEKRLLRQSPTAYAKYQKQVPFFCGKPKF